MQFHIEHMECGGCARGVIKAIQSVDPTAQVETDPPNRKARITSNMPGVDFLPALSAAGFPATLD